MSSPDDPRSWTDEHLDEVIRSSVPQLDLVRFMHLADIDLPDHDASDPVDPVHTPVMPSVGPRRAGRAAARSRQRRAAAIVGIAAVAVAVGVYLTVGAASDDDRVDVIGTPPVQTTTIAPAPQPNEVEHLTDVADRSLALRSDLGDLTPAVDELLAEPAVPKELTVSEYFAASTFPALAPLPGRTTWMFLNPRIRSTENPCALFTPRPLTMTGFAGPAWLSAQADVSVVTYSATGPAEAGDFFVGRSLQLGVPEAECMADTSGNLQVAHRDLPLTDVSGRVEQWNSWTFASPDPLLPEETGAYGYLLRTGDQILEIRVGVRNHTTLTPERLSSFVGDVVAAVGP